MLRALPGGRSRPSTKPAPRRQARLPDGARAQGAVAVDLDDPQRQPSAPEPRRAQGRRPPGVERLGRDLDDRALFRRAAAAGPGRGQAARRRRCSTRIQYLLGHQSRDKLERFRAFGGAQSYPSRTKDGETVDFSTGSVGLGVGMTLFASLVQDYLRLKQLVPTDDAARPHDRARRRRRARRGQHLRGAARGLEARCPQSLVGHRLQPPEPRRGRLGPAVRPHRRDVRDDGLARRHPEIRPPAAGRLRPARRRIICASGSTPARTRSIRRWSTRAARAGASICTATSTAIPASARSSTSTTMRRLQRLMTNLAGHDMESVLDAFHARHRRPADLLHRLYDQGLRPALRRPQGQPCRADEPRPDGVVPAQHGGGGGRRMGAVRRARPAAGAARRVPRAACRSPGRAGAGTTPPRSRCRRACRSRAAHGFRPRKPSAGILGRHRRRRQRRSPSAS